MRVCVKGEFLESDQIDEFRGRDEHKTLQREKMIEDEVKKLKSELDAICSEIAILLNF